MARYFGGFRDRLKKRSKHLPITTKDVEWVKVATTFTWSPAKRDYQWLEPEDYLSSFLSSSDGQYDDLNGEIQGDGSIDAAMNLPFSGSEYDGSESLLSMPSSDESEEEKSSIGYIPPYDFVPETTPAFNDEAVLRPNIDVPADLPMLDEYKLEIVSALQRRGIKINSSKIKLPEDLSAQLNGYHEGRVSIDSYELRARLQKYKRQVIESYEKFSAVSGSINPEPNGSGKSIYDEEATLEPPQSSDSNYESFILTSLNRLEASMNEDDLAFEAGHSDVNENDEIIVEGIVDNQNTPANNLESPDILEGLEKYDVFDESNQTLDVRGAIRTTRQIETPPDTSDILAEGLTGPEIKDGSSEGELPSSYADDSWLVLPVDSRKAGQDLENPDDLDSINDTDNIGEDTLVVDILGAESHDADTLDAVTLDADTLDADTSPLDLLDEEEAGALESNRADSSELLKALNTINSRFPESSTVTDELEVATDQVDLDVDALNGIPEPNDEPEQILEPGKPDAIGLDDTGDIAVAPISETSNNEVSSEKQHVASDETSLSDLLLQLRHEGDRTILDDVNRSQESEPLSVVDEELEADPIIGIEPANEPFSLEEIDADSIYEVAYAAHPEQALESKPPIQDDFEEIKPVSLDLEMEPPSVSDRVEIAADASVPHTQNAADQHSLEIDEVKTSGVVDQSFEKKEEVSPGSEKLATEKSITKDPVPVTKASRDQLPGETVEQRRARFIEEERKKLYSLIGDLEENASLADQNDNVTEELKNEVDATQSALKVNSSLIENIMAAKEQLDNTGIISEAKPAFTSSNDADGTVELSADQEEKGAPQKAVPSEAVPKEIKLAPNELVIESDSKKGDVVETDRPGSIEKLIDSGGEIEDIGSKDIELREHDTASELAPENIDKAPAKPEKRTSSNIIDPEPVEEPLASEAIEVTNAREPEPDKKSVPESPPVVNTRTFGSLGEIESAPLPKKVVEQPEIARPSAFETKRSHPEVVKSGADKTQKQTASKSFVREESLHNDPRLSSQAIDPVFSPDPTTTGVDKIAKPAEPSDESRVAVDQKAFKMNTLVDTGAIGNERSAIEKKNQPEVERAHKSAEIKAEKDASQVKSERSGRPLAGHTTESEQLSPVSIDKTFMSEPQTTEEETPMVSDVSTSKPVEIVTSPTPDVDSPTVVTVDLDGVGIDKAAPAKEIVDEGLIEADEAQSPDVSLIHVIESLAFATEDPIPLKKIARIYSETLGVKMPTEKKVREALGKLNEEYTASGRAYRIKEWAGGVRMASHPQYARFIRALYKDNRPKKLSRTLMETLAIIAYSQPSTKPEIDFVRGVDSDYAVRKLLELGLIDIVGRSDSIGRPLLYGTSERFLEQFGLSGIEALPKLREVEELLGDPAFKKERLQLLALEDMETANNPKEDSGEEAAVENDSDKNKPAETEGDAIQGNSAEGETAEPTESAASLPTDVSGTTE